MIPKLGIMRGRLLPKFSGRYQAHPLGYWEDEFSIASDLGLECIEFIFDFNDYQQNPLFSNEGIREIEKISSKTGVVVYSVCADFFMECPLHSIIEENRIFAKKTLLELLSYCNNLNITDIVIPCVDHSSLVSTENFDIFKTQMTELIPVAENFDINLSLETDLPPSSFANLLQDLDSKNVTVNYDIGNSASLGYDFRVELQSYGKRISDLHIKDRKLNGPSVYLGQGNAKIVEFFKEFQKYDFKGPTIMQLFRDDEGVTILKEQLGEFRKLVKPFMR